VADTLENLIEGERRRRLRMTLSRLSMQERQCMELRMEGLRYREIAEVLGTRISSVQSYLVRAVQKVLREFDV
jgi:RNA polymerase sigma-70 factor (ECF subfamily)